MTSSPKKLSDIRCLLQARILEGKWKAGEKLPTDAELAQELECSVGTLSKALGFLVHDGFMSRRPKAGTIVLKNSASSRPPAVQLDAFAVIYPSEQHEGIARMLRGFHEANLEKGRRLVLLPTGLDFRKEAELLASLAEFDVKGAVACPVTATPQDQLNVQTLLLRSKVPVVLMGAYHPGFAAGAVHLDNFASGYKMTRYLIDKGARKIGFLANWSWVEFVRERLGGYQWAMREAGIEVPSAWTYLANAMHANLGDPLAEPEAIATGFLATRPGVDAVVCADDFLAVGLARAAARIGLRVPKDLKITGMENMEISRTGPVPMTTLDVPFEVIGRRSLELLDCIVSGASRPNDDIKVFGEIVERKSA
ncbi:MAG: GntR family transcriptional regulator [Terrimicrobiaceae bacterium]